MNALRASCPRTALGGCKTSRLRCGCCWRRHRQNARRLGEAVRGAVLWATVLFRTKELRLLDAAYIGKLRPRWDGPFTVTACPSPNAYTLALPRRMRCSQTVNVDRLKPYVERPADLPPPGPAADAGQEGEHEVELLINRDRWLVRGVIRYPVRWRGHLSVDDEWLRLEALAHCPEKVAEHDAAAPRRRHAQRRRDAAALDAASGPGVPPLSRHRHHWLRRSGSGQRARLRF
jgi:hypothetical protein